MKLAAKVSPSAMQDQCSYQWAADPAASLTFDDATKANAVATVADEAEAGSVTVTCTATDPDKNAVSGNQKLEIAGE